MKDSPLLAAFVQELRSDRIPIVNVSGQFSERRIPRVCGDDPQIGRLAAEHFAERRFTSSAWFSSNWGHVQQLRYAAFVKAWRSAVPDAAGPLRLVWSEHAPGKTRMGWPELSRWLGESINAAPKPLGVFAYSDYDASRVIAICRERGLDVPGEVAPPPTWEWRPTSRPYNRRRRESPCAGQPTPSRSATPRSEPQCPSSPPIFPSRSVHRRLRTASAFPDFGSIDCLRRSSTSQ